jgi:beta-galactosidase
MKHILHLTALLILLVSCQRTPPREAINFDADWRFKLGNDSLAFVGSYDDSQWRQLNLPHDWSIEGKFDEANPAKPEGGALPTGIGWYRKTFDWKSNPDKVVFIEFDGVYRNSEVWLNGHSLGKRPSGYSSFRYEMTLFLVEGKNVISVKVDNSAQPNSRWYSGSGIYRHVRVVSMGKVHVDQWGTFATTPFVSADSATVKLDVRLANQLGQNTTIAVKSILMTESGYEVARAETEPFIANTPIVEVSHNFEVEKPMLWDVNDPRRYNIVTQVMVDGDVVDVYQTPIGIRTFNFDAKKGFSLNGKPMKILGVCLHHDLGALGAAVNTRAMARQLEILKEMGCNAIRTSHNPPAPEFLDLCDQMGFVVMDEAFDVWKKKKVKFDYSKDWDENHVRDLEDMVRRDRNHPSVMIWSIGNEIREQFDSTGIAIAKELTDIVKKLDNTRPVTSALTENDPAKNFIYQSKSLDLIGFNYKHDFYPRFPKVYPGQKFIATETMSALATRGYYDLPSDSIRRWPTAYNVPLVGANDACMVSAYDNVSAYWGSTHEETWKVIKKNDFMSGLFVWTGFDYIGEPTPYPWPARSSYFGIVDLAGFPKDAYYMYQSEWTDKPVLHLFPHWNWQAGQTVDVWAYYNNADEVELFVNGKSAGVKTKTGDDLHVMWRVTYEAGIIKAVSRKNGQTVLEREIKTAGVPARIELTADRTNIAADGSDLSFVTVRIVDKDGNMVPTADNLVNFALEGEGFIAGVDNGYQASMEPFKANYRMAFNGMCLAIVQNNGHSGTIKLKATSKGLQSAEVVVNCTKN